MLYADLPQHVRDFDPTTFMVAKDAAGVASARSAAIQKIFGVAALDTAYRLTATQDGPPVSMPNLSFCQRFTAALPFGLSSNVYFFVPVTGRPQPAVVIYHEGHGAIAYNRSNVIAPLIAAGYMVAAIDMPMTGMNAGQTIAADIAGIGPVNIWGHQQLEIMDGGAVNPLSLFLLPTLATVNHCIINGVPNVAMMGLSGGGWTTTLYAALDPRILRSYSVSGTMPEYLRGWNNQDDWSDHEQRLPGLGLDYLDLYVMASTGRTHWQVGNVNDPACFSGTRQDCFKTQIASLASAIGGTFAVVYDTTATAHDVSTWAISQIGTDLGTQF